jgi:hypothetical protein
MRQVRPIKFSPVIMASISRFLFVLIALVCLSRTAPLALEDAGPAVRTVTPPDDDEFYRAPPGYRNATLGSILRYRPVPNPLAIDNKTPFNIKAAWQIQYRTQNSVGEPEASIVTVLVPHNARPSHLHVYAYYTVSTTFFFLWLSDVMLILRLPYLASSIQWVSLRIHNS